jgi:DNA repair protein RadD
VSAALRPYQAQALEAVRAELRAGKRRVLLVSPTGSGKSVIIAEMVQGAVAKGNTVVFLAHRRELVTQLSDRLTRNGLTHGILMGGRPRQWSLPVQVASIQTLARVEMPEPELVLLDEAHHAASDSYRKLLAERWPNARVVGYTASPWRTDGRGLGELFDASVVAARPRELIDAGYLCRYTGFAFMAPDLSSVPVVAGDYDEGALTLAYRSSRILGDVVGKWLEHARGVRTILFAPSIESSLDFVAQFRAAGVTAEHVDYLSADEDREAILARARSGETTVTCNVALLTEGVDVPEWKCVIMCRPTKSPGLYLQQVGRVFRPVGDQVARIHDHAENCQRHGLPDADRDYSLGSGKAKDKAPPPVVVCVACMAVYDPRGLNHCPVCGVEPPTATVPREGPKVMEGVEVPLEQAAAGLPPRPDQLRQFDLWLTEARKRGWKPGWAIHKFESAFPQAPKPWGVWRQHVDKQGRWKDAEVAA